MNALLKLRKKIDLCDRELVNVFTRRFFLVKKIALFKKQNNIKSLDTIRWREVLGQTLFLSKKKGLSSGFMKHIMNLIHKESLRIEKHIISQKPKYAPRNQKK